MAGMWYAVLEAKKKKKHTLLRSTVQRPRESVRRPLPPLLQGVQALLASQGVLRAHFVGCLCGGDVNLRVLGGAPPCRDTKGGPRFECGSDV